LETPDNDAVGREGMHFFARANVIDVEKNILVRPARSAEPVLERNSCEVVFARMTDEKA